MRKRVVAVTVSLLVLASFVFAGSGGMPVFQQPQTSRTATTADDDGKMIDLKSDDGFQREWRGEKIHILVGNVAAYHNGAVITCDSAVRYSDSRLECFGNVLINKGTTYVYGDRAEYDRPTNRASVYSDIIKVVDRGTTLYTYNFVFNTETNIGEFYGGGVVLDEDNLLESDRGYYNSDTREVICVERVEMRNETYQMKGDSVIYNIATNYAEFFTNTNIWNDGEEEYLYADRGSFDRDSQRYTLTLNGYILTDEQEAWSDSLDYYRERGYALLQGNIQLDDSKQKMLAFGDWGEYWKEPGNIFLTKNPAIISYDLSQGDSVFMRSDSMFLYTRDPVKERLEREQAEAEAKAAEEAKANAEQSESRLGDKAASEDVSGENDGRQEALRERAEGASEAVKRNLNSHKDRAEHRQNGKRQEEKPHNEEKRQTPTDAPDATDAPAGQHDDMAGQQATPSGVGADSTQLASTASLQDSLPADSTATAPADTLSKAEKRAILVAQAKAERAAQRKIKAEALRKKLDEIADRRQAKRTAQLRRMEAADSVRRAKARLRAEERMRRSLAKMTKRGIKVKPVDGAVWESIDSMIVAEGAQDSVACRMLDSLAMLYFPKAAADSLAVADTVAVDSTYRLIVGYRGVRIFRSDFQTLCDSLVTSSADSVIHLYVSPVLWNDNNQITSEVIHLYTQNQQAVRADFEGKPLTISEIDTVHYNQISGKEMTAYFRDNQIYRNDVNGNVQTLYYMEEGNPSEITMLAYIESADMTSYIENRQVVGITYRGNPTYTFYPMDKIPEERSLYLDGFAWHAKNRPTRNSVFTRPIRESLREEKQNLARPKFPIRSALDRKRERLIKYGSWSDRTDTLTVETLEWIESLSSVY